MYIVIKAIDLFLTLLEILIFARVLLSWFPINPDNPIINIIYQLTEPILGPIRKMLQNSILGGRGMMLDFSPIIAWLLIGFLRNLL